MIAGVGPHKRQALLLLSASLSLLFCLASEKVQETTGQTILLRHSQCSLLLCAHQYCYAPGKRPILDSPVIAAHRPRHSSPDVKLGAEYWELCSRSEVAVGCTRSQQLWITVADRA